MAEKLVKWALDNRVLVLILGVVLTVVGVQQAQRLRIDAVPDVTNVQVQILTKASALAPVEVERQHNRKRARGRGLRAAGGAGRAGKAHAG